MKENLKIYIHLKKRAANVDTPQISSMLESVKYKRPWTEEAEEGRWMDCRTMMEGY